MSKLTVLCLYCGAELFDTSYESKIRKRHWFCSICGAELSTQKENNVQAQKEEK